MNSKYRLTTLILLVLTLTLSNVFAGNIDTINFVDEISGIPVTNVQFELYRCTDADCNNIQNHVLSRNSGASSSVTYEYPYTTRENYGAFAYAACYLDDADAYWVSGDGQHWTFTASFEKAASCSAQIESFEITNQNYVNEPVVINMATDIESTTHSAFRRIPTSTPVWRPSGYDSYYSAETEVTLEIIDDSTNMVIYTETKPRVEIMRDNAITHTWNWVPNLPGGYTARVTSEVTDCQCSSQITRQSEKQFTVWPARPRDQCYTLLQNLTSTPVFPIEGDTLNITFEKISNYAATDYSKTPTPTTLAYRMLDQSNNIIDSGVQTIPANVNGNDYTVQTLQWTNVPGGLNTIELTGIADSALCTGKTNPTDTISMNVNVVGTVRYNVTFNVMNSYTNLPEDDIIINFDVQTGRTDSAGNTFFKIRNGTYSYSINDPQFYPVSGTVTVAGLDQTINIVLTPLPVSANSLYCNPYVITGHQQFCNTTVLLNNSPVGGATVTFRNITDDVILGTCTTDAISGACTGYFTAGSPGDYTVYSTAELAGYVSDLDKNPNVTYTVLAERYDILNLSLYNDSSFTNPDNVFYRAENMYLKFQVRDQLGANQLISNMATSAVLTSPAGGIQNMTFINYSNYWYYYQVNIPPSHAFIGSSEAFAFAFNFSNSSGGQESVSLTILNNPPVISPTVPNLSINILGQLNLGLSSFENDIEDSGNDLTWSIEGFSSGLILPVVNGKVLTITPVANGNSPLTLRLTDLDGDSDTQTITVSVNVSGFNNSAPYFTSTPGTYFQTNSDNSNEYNYDADAVDPEGDAVTYTLTSAPNGMSINSVTGLVTWTPSSRNKGAWTITVRATDIWGLFATQTYTLTVDQKVTVFEPREAIKVETMRMNYGAYDVVSAGDSIFISTTFGSVGDYNMARAQIRITCPELGISRKIGPFGGPGSNDYETKGVMLDIPQDARPGVYTCRMNLYSHDGLYRVKHRDFRVN